MCLNSQSGGLKGLVCSYGSCGANLLTDEQRLSPHSGHKGAVIIIHDGLMPSQVSVKSLFGLSAPFIFLQQGQTQKSVKGHTLKLCSGRREWVGVGRL